MGFVAKRLFALPLVAFQVVGRTTVSDMEWEHFNLVNKKRAEGFTCPDGTVVSPVPQPLVFECRLWKAAYPHSQEMADHNFFNRASLDGTPWWERAEAVGASAHAIIIGPSGSAQEILDLWLSSNDQCNLIGDPLFRYFAIGHGFNASSDWKDYWTQMYGDFPPRAGVDTSCYPNTTTTQHTTTKAPTITSTRVMGQNQSLDTAVSTSMPKLEPEPSSDSLTTTANSLRGLPTSGARQLQGKLLYCLVLIVASSLLRAVL